MHCSLDNHVNEVKCLNCEDEQTVIKIATKFFALFLYKLQILEYFLKYKNMNEIKC